MDDWMDPSKAVLWLIIAAGIIGFFLLLGWTWWRSRFPPTNLEILSIRGSTFGIDQTLTALQSPVEKAIHLVECVQIDIERNLFCLVIPFFWRYATIRRQLQTLEKARQLLSKPMPLLSPDLMEEINNGRVQVDSDTKNWLAYELAQRTERQYDSQQHNTPRKSRSYSITVMRNDSYDTGPLSTIGTWSFDIFALKEERNEELPLAAVGFCLFLKYNLFKRLALNMDRVEMLMVAIDDGYRQNPYHNHLHGADVAQTASFLIEQSECVLLFRPQDILAIILAALCHDIDHPGTTNGFQIATDSNLSILYNDRSVLENHHASFSRRLMRQSKLNILQHMAHHERQGIEELFMKCVLATDISTNFEGCAQFRRAHLAAISDQGLARVSRRSLVPKSTDVVASCRALVLNRETFPVLCTMILKCSDVGHCGKSWRVHERFSANIQEEFYCQGDQERELGLPISPYMDRRNPGNSAKNQFGFFEFLVQPLLATLTDAISIDEIIDGVENNLSQWKHRSVAWRESDSTPIQGDLEASTNLQSNVAAGDLNVTSVPGQPLQEGMQTPGGIKEDLSQQLNGVVIGN